MKEIFTITPTNLQTTHTILFTKNATEGEKLTNEVIPLCRSFLPLGFGTSFGTSEFWHTCWYIDSATL